MQLMPKQLIGNIGGAYLKNSTSVLFHPQPCEALDSLTKVMSSGFVRIGNEINFFVSYHGVPFENIYLYFRLVAFILQALPRHLHAI